MAASGRFNLEIGFLRFAAAVAVLSAAIEGPFHLDLLKDASGVVIERSPTADSTTFSIRRDGNKADVELVLGLDLPRAQVRSVRARLFTWPARPRVIVVVTMARGAEPPHVAFWQIFFDKDHASDDSQKSSWRHWLRIAQGVFALIAMIGAALAIQPGPHVPYFVTALSDAIDEVKMVDPRTSADFPDVAVRRRMLRLKLLGDEITEEAIRKAGAQGPVQINDIATWYHERGLDEVFALAFAKLHEPKRAPQPVAPPAAAPAVARVPPPATPPVSPAPPNDTPPRAGGR